MAAQPQRRKLKHWVALLLTVPLLPVSVLVHRHWKRKARNEWQRRKNEPSGSAMTLFFSRGA